MIDKNILRKRVSICIIKLGFIVLLAFVFLFYDVRPFWYISKGSISIDGVIYRNEQATKSRHNYFYKKYILEYKIIDEKYKSRIKIFIFAEPFLTKNIKVNVSKARHDIYVINETKYLLIGDVFNFCIFYLIINIIITKWDYINRKGIYKYAGLNNQFKRF